MTRDSRLTPDLIDLDRYAVLNAHGIEGLSGYQGRSSAAVAYAGAPAKWTMSEAEKAAGRGTRAEQRASWKRVAGAAIAEAEAAKRGRAHSAETKRKISEARRKWWRQMRGWDA